MNYSLILVRMRRWGFTNIRISSTKFKESLIGKRGGLSPEPRSAQKKDSVGNQGYSLQVCRRLPMSSALRGETGATI